MSASNGNPLDPVEVASLAADDSRRAAFLQTLTSAAEREAWEREWAASDRLRQMLQQVDLPAELQNRLKQIPEKTAVDPDKSAPRSTWNIQLGWRSVAAILLIAGIVTGVYWWATRDTRPAPIDRAISQSIATWAVKQSDAPLAITSSDAEAVRQKLASFGYDFPVLMLTPNEGVTLQGGGTADLGPAKAVFTKWAGQGYTLTLYEFNGKNVKAPPVFQTQSEIPQELWRDDLHYRVLVFPGQEGKCCWALVMDTDQAQNAFSRYTARIY